MRSRKKANEHTSEKPISKEGTHYPLLHKSEPKGIVTSELEHIGNQMRKHYTPRPQVKKVEREYVRTMGIQLKRINDPVA